jgi:hypothetical protein
MEPSQSRRVVAVLREPVFSPGMVEHDAAILRASAGELSRRHGIACPVLTVGEVAALPAPPELALTMAEGDDSLAVFDRLQERGTVVINSPAGVRATRRQALLALGSLLVRGALVETDDGDRIPPELLAGGSAWVKRADYHALGPGDVTHVASSQVIPTLRAMRDRGIERAVVQPHLAGPVIKFYGVANASPFFRWFAVAGGRSPSPRELQQLEARAFQAARAAGISVFGGDAVLSETEAPVVIDLNAWPSFWRCLADAAAAIAEHAASRLPSRVA